MIGSVYCQNIKTDSIIKPVQKDLIENMHHKKHSTPKDRETKAIISFMSNLDDESIKTELQNHGYATTILNTLKPEEKDSALYETILEMNQKYGDPKITSKRSGILNGKYYRGQFSPITHNIRINAKIYNNKKEMVSIRLAELSHAKQYQGKRMILRMLKDGVKLLENGFKYDKMYDQKETIEFEAHKEVEPELYVEFIQSYRDKIDIHDAKENIRAIERIEFLSENMDKEKME